MASNSNLPAPVSFRRSSVVKLDSHSRSSSIRGLDTIVSDVEHGEVRESIFDIPSLRIVQLSSDQTVSSSEHQYTIWEKLKLRSGYYLPGTSSFRMLHLYPYL